MVVRNSFVCLREAFAYVAASVLDSRIQYT